jgi:hypothetical protein
MSNVKPIAKKTVKIKENELVDLIDNIVNETVAIKKKEWIAEQAKKENEKTAVLESRLAKLEATLKTLTEGKK